MLPPSRTLGIGAQPDRVPCLIERPGRKIKNGPRSIFFARHEAKTVQFEKENSDHKSRSLIAIYKGMVADNARRVQCSHLNDIGSLSVGMVLAGTGERRLQEPAITQASSPTVGGQ